MAGDYLHWQFQFTRKNTNFILTTTTDSTAAIIAVRSANHRIYIQKVSMSVTTYAAKTWTLRDDAGTPVPVCILSIPAAQATAFGDEGSVVFDFGPTGFPLTLGKNLDFVASATGAAGIIHIEAYEKLDATVAAASTN